MRPLVLLCALLAVTWMIAGCGEERDSITPVGPQGVAPQTAEMVPDADRTAESRIDVEATHAALAQQLADHQGKALAPGTGMRIIVPDPANGIFNCQDGIDAAAPGAVVTVLPGTFVEDVFLWVPDITFRAENRHLVTILGSFMVFADNVKIEGFRLQPGPFSGYGIWVDDYQGVEIRHNVLTGWDCGVLMYLSDGGLIEENEFVRNFYGAELWRAPDNIVAKNEFTQAEIGAYLFDSHVNRVRDNVMMDVQIGVQLDESNGGFVRRNEITSPYIAVKTYLSHGNEIGENILTADYWGLDLEYGDRNVIQENKVFGTAYDDIYLYSSDFNMIRGNDLQGNGDDGLDLHGDSHDNMIVGTLSLDHRHNGIELEPGVFNNVVTKSRAHGNLGCDIVQYGTGNVFFDNEADCTSGF